MTGDVARAADPILVRERIIAKEEFAYVLDEATKLGIDTIPSQQRGFILSHFDDWYGIRRDTMKTATWLQIAGGLHKDPDAIKLLDFVYDLCPEFLPNRQA